ncbi:hypothetical protein LA080_016032 [Diaporthe eres]|nr:hypothetical protein LA080_016032 [Diaporthe eres]
MGSQRRHTFSFAFDVHWNLSQSTTVSNTTAPLTSVLAFAAIQAYVHETDINRNTVLSNSHRFKPTSKLSMSAAPTSDPSPTRMWSTSTALIMPWHEEMILMSLVDETELLDVPEYTENEPPFGPYYNSFMWCVPFSLRSCWALPRQLYYRRWPVQFSISFIWATSWTSPPFNVEKEAATYTSLLAS